MDKKEAKRLKIGDRVEIWAESPDRAVGTVIEIGFNAVKIEWDDGQVGPIHLNDMQDVSRYHGQP